MQTQTDFIVFFIASIRVISMIISSPIFSIRQIPALVKVGLSLIIGFLISSTLNLSNVVLPSTSYGLLGVCAKEIIVGVSIGYISTLIFNAVRVSAQFMDFGIGFSMSQYYDPSTAGNSTPLERFFNWFSIVLFLTFNFHHIIISAVINSFEVVPVGNFTVTRDIAPVIFNVFSNSFYLAIQLAAPILIILFITDFTMGLIARAVPQINVFILGMPIKVLVGLLSISMILPGLSHIYVKVFENMNSDYVKFFNVFPAILLMAADEKTEEPTAKKLSDAKKKGQVAKSIELNSAIILFGVTMIFLIFGNSYYQKGVGFIVDSFGHITRDAVSQGNMSSIFIYMLENGAAIAVPILLTVMILGIVANVVQTGIILSGEGLKPKLEKLNPIEGFKKFFSKRAFVELLKNLLKISIIAYITFSYVNTRLDDILKTSDLSPVGVYAFVKSITDSQLIRLVIFIFIIGIADYIFQKRQFRKDMKMTKQEVKEEFKQAEGDPQIKSRIRQKQREFAMKRMMHEVPKATVVITNPTHFAVALRYEKESGSAPIVVAKGADLVALRIKEIAKENNVPIVENKPLARALYAKVEIDQAVPVELYQAVAEIIAYVYSLKRM